MVRRSRGRRPLLLAAGQPGEGYAGSCRLSPIYPYRNEGRLLRYPSWPDPGNHTPHRGDGDGRHRLPGRRLHRPQHGQLRRVRERARQRRGGLRHPRYRRERDHPGRRRPPDADGCRQLRRQQPHLRLCAPGAHLPAGRAGERSRPASLAQPDPRRPAQRHPPRRQRPRRRVERAAQRLLRDRRRGRLLHRPALGLAGQRRPPQLLPRHPRAGQRRRPGRLPGRLCSRLPHHRQPVPQRAQRRGDLRRARYPRREQHLRGLPAGGARGRPWPQLDEGHHRRLHAPDAQGDALPVAALEHALSAGGQCPRRRAGRAEIQRRRAQRLLRRSLAGHRGGREAVSHLPGQLDRRRSRLRGPGPWQLPAEGGLAGVQDRVPARADREDGPVRR